MPNWKPSRTARKLAERKTKLERRQKETTAKAAVRRRDQYRCRFPRCGCRTIGLRLEVGHLRHKGIGGNPLGDRSTPDGMILLCGHRHQHGAVSLHKGTLEPRALTSDGMNGPVAWFVDASALWSEHAGEGWILVAVEERVQKVAALTLQQELALERLAEMTL